MHFGMCLQSSPSRENRLFRYRTDAKVGNVRWRFRKRPKRAVHRVELFDLLILLRELFVFLLDLLALLFAELFKLFYAL